MENDVDEKKRFAAAEKAKGNKFFGKRDYRQAIEHYSKVKRANDDHALCCVTHSLRCDQLQ